MTARGFFVTGTDTGVGKTLVACALLHAFASRGLRAVGMKPVAAGAEWRDGVLINDDVAQLMAASNVTAPRELINPYCFEPPIAPHIAASLAGVEISINRLLTCFDQLAVRAERVIVEGAGGFCVPLNARETSADLAQRLALQVVMVVGMRLGCINHALLTAEAIRARGLLLAGWIANHIGPAMAQADANVATLRERLSLMGAPMIGRIMYCAHSGAPRAASIATQFELNNVA